MCDSTSTHRHAQTGSAKDMEDFADLSNTDKLGSILNVTWRESSASIAVSRRRKWRDLLATHQLRSLQGLLQKLC